MLSLGHGMAPDDDDHSTVIFFTVILKVNFMLCLAFSFGVTLRLSPVDTGQILRVKHCVFIKGLSAPLHRVEKEIETRK